MGAEEEGPRRAVVVAQEVDHRGVLLPRLQLLAAGGGSRDGDGDGVPASGLASGSGAAMGSEEGALGVWG